MKKILLLFIGLSSIATTLLAQYNFNYSRDFYWDQGIANYPSVKQDLAKELGIQKYNDFRVIVKKNGKEKRKPKSEELYNSVGKLISDSWYDKGKLKSKSEYTYDNNDKLIAEKVLNNKGEELIRKEVKINELGFTTEYKYFKKGDEIPYYSYVREFDSTRIIKLNNYKKGDLSSYTLYQYYEDGSREKIQYFNAKGKLKYTWSYECKPEGERTYKHKDTTRYCIVNSHDSSGNLMRIFLSTNEKNKLTKSVSIYDKDTILIESTSYDKDDVMLYKLTYLNGNRLYNHYYSYRKGKLKSYRFNDFNEKGERISYKYFKYRGDKERILSHFEFKYNESGLLVDTHYYYKGKVTVKNPVEYVYFTD